VNSWVIPFLCPKISVMTPENLLARRFDQVRRMSDERRLATRHLATGLWKCSEWSALAR